MLKLPDVTLVMVETRTHELARLTGLHCVKQIEFAEVLVHTDKPHLLDIPGARYIVIPDFNGNQFANYSYFDAYKTVQTSHVLFLEHDAGVCDVNKWQPEFMEVDYVGAPWWYTDGLNVGNGGFSLRSMRLIRFLSKERAMFPANTDNKLCRDYRRAIEKAGGFKWAEEELAHNFSVEQCQPVGSPMPFFGYHRSHHWPDILSREDLIERTRALMRAPENGPHYYRKELLERAPWLAAEIA